MLQVCVGALLFMTSGIVILSFSLLVYTTCVRVYRKVKYYKIMAIRRANRYTVDK